MNIKRVKIFGAGSIGNHLANAARVLGADVVVCDVNEAALERMKKEIYPTRYGGWDEKIQLSSVKEAPRGGFDLICIGTPPQHHLPIALEALTEKPRAIQVEKPLCPPSLQHADDFWNRAKAQGTHVFLGYDHVVGRAARKTEELLSEGAIGKIETLDVEFREHWGGIFRAHPWLAGPWESYLGFWEAGGGASGEHSHALNLWQHFAHCIGAGKVAEVDAMVHYVRDDRCHYDDLCLLNLRTQTGFTGRVVQDVVTQPVRKVAYVQGQGGTIQWINGYNSKGDAVILSRVNGAAPEIMEMPKRRPDDFIEELKHIDAALEPGAAPSPISLERGLDTMLVVAAAHVAEREKRRVAIDYSAGYKLSALKTS
jgi:predicted dehydrogenase